MNAAQTYADDFVDMQAELEKGIEVNGKTVEQKQISEENSESDSDDEYAKVIKQLSKSKLAKTIQLKRRSKRRFTLSTPLEDGLSVL